MVIPSDTNPLAAGLHLEQSKLPSETVLFGFIILWVSLIVIFLFPGTLSRAPDGSGLPRAGPGDHIRLFMKSIADWPDLVGILEWG